MPDTAYDPLTCRRSTRLGRSFLVFTATVLAIAAAPKGNANDLTATDPVDHVVQWITLCRSDSTVTQYVNDWSETMIKDGFAALSSNGADLPIEEFTDIEACLSLSASAEMQTPVFVVSKSLSLDELPGSAESIKALQAHHVTQHLVHRMQKADINLFSMQGRAGNRSLDEMLRIDPDLAHETLNFGAITGIDRQQRSFAVKGNQACVIALEETPLEPFAEMRLANQSIAPSVGRFLKTHGRSVEFWHEAAHCNMSVAGKTIKQELDASGTGPSRSCAASTIPMDFDSRPDDDLTPNDHFAGAMDNRILHSLQQESLADEFGMTMANRYQGAPRAGCHSPEVISHPWQRYRLMDSLNHPRADYMTWLIPWLKDQSTGVQRQMVSDAYQGLYQAAKTLLPEEQYRSIVHAQSILAGTQAFNTPSANPDPVRAKAWAAWIEAQVTDLGLSQ